MFVDTRTFEILLRTYEVKETRVEFSKGDEGFSLRSPPHKKRQQSTDKGNAMEASGPATVMAKPCGESRGHTVPGTGNLELHSWGVLTCRITSYGMSVDDMVVNGMVVGFGFVDLILL
ncbi:U6 snRNA phosphodiesterase [Bienertia sinuspersici]